MIEITLINVVVFYYYYQTLFIFMNQYLPIKKLGLNSASLLIVLALCSFVILPFLIFGPDFESIIKYRFLQSDRYVSFLIVIVLLSMDIVLPIPSSAVSIWSGYSLGITWGTISTSIGMTVSCIIGYFLGKHSSFLLSKNSLNKFRQVDKRVRVSSIIFFRGVPVLAEAFAMAMGLGNYPFKEFLLWSTLANIGISFIYALAGYMGNNLNNIFLVVLSAIALPIVFQLLKYLTLSRRHKNV
ncbi:MAG: VTT domain-containing protein [candidate division Zixibacteria bacterium]|nr:VTT domain-containing protein [candidate division Zixibacteria bacterium]